MANGLHPPVSAGSAFHFSVFDLSVPDLTVIGLMVVVFVLSIVIPFPGGKEKK